MFIRYNLEHKEYTYLYSIGRVYIARHVFLNEYEFPFVIEENFVTNKSECSTSSQPNYQQLLLLSYDTFSTPK